MEQGEVHDQDRNENAGRREFLKNLTALGAAGVPAAMLADAARANPLPTGSELMRLAQAEEPKPKPRPKPQITKPVEKGDFRTLQEIVFAAKRNLPPDLWTHLTGGSDSETTIRRNRMAFETLALRQRVLVNVNNIDLSTTLLGRNLSLPVFISPVGGYTGLAHPQGVLPVVRAAEAAGTFAIVASNVRPGFEAAAKASKSPFINQLYITSDRKWLDRSAEPRKGRRLSRARRDGGSQLLRAPRKRHDYGFRAGRRVLRSQPPGEPRLGSDRLDQGLP
jgi:hypothetical protein